MYPMSCCSRPVRVTAQAPGGASEAALPVQITVEYTGPTALTVHGPVSGRRYRFDRRGSRVAVDLRDVPSMATVPHLRRAPAV